MRHLLHSQNSISKIFKNQSSSLAKCQEKVTSATPSIIFSGGGLDQLGVQVDAVKAKYKEEAAQADHAAVLIGQRFGKTVGQTTGGGVSEVVLLLFW